MINPYQTTIDISSLPAAIQNLVATVDNQLTSWNIDEVGKTLTVTWANLSGWTQAKETGLKQLVTAYERLGWITQQITKDGNTTNFKVLFYRP